MTIAPRVKWLYHQQFPADDATQKADDAASEDEAEPEEEISDDEDELTFTGKKDGLVTPPPPAALTGDQRDSSSLGVSRLMVTTD